MKQFGQNNLIWGNGNLTEISVLRKKYIQALHDADNGDYTALLNFVNDG